MAKVIIKVNTKTGAIEDIGEIYSNIPDGYTEVELAYPPDIMGGYYKLVDGEAVKDEYLYRAFVEAQGADDEVEK